MVVDLRNFTNHLNASRSDAEGIQEFLHFLGRFYGLCLDVAMLSFPEEERGKPPVFITSTGDGMIVVFTSPERHYAHGFLAALVLHAVLERTCERYNQHVDRGAPLAGFGIGLESGVVSRIRATAGAHPDHPVVDTFIGDCINVASRAQDLSKQLDRAHTIVSGGTNTLLCHHLFGDGYAQIMQQAGDRTLGDAERLVLHNRMNELNRVLCLAFIHVHQLRGVPVPVPLFRVSESAVRLGNKRYESLLARLVDGNEAHLAEIIAVLAGGPL